MYRGHWWNSLTKCGTFTCPTVAGLPWNLGVQQSAKLLYHIPFPPFVGTVSTDYTSENSLSGLSLHSFRVQNMEHVQEMRSHNTLWALDGHGTPGCQKCWAKGWFWLRLGQNFTLIRQGTNTFMKIYLQPLSQKGHAKYNKKPLLSTAGPCNGI